MGDAAERDRLELAFRTGLGDALCWTRGFAAPEVEAAYARAHALSGNLGASAQSFRILWGLWHFYVIRGDLHRSSELALELTDLGRCLADASLVPHVCRTRGEDSLWRGEFTRVLRETAPCLDASLPVPAKPIPGVQDPLLMCLAWRAFARWHLGYPDQALVDVAAAMERGRQSPHAGDRGAALIFLAWIHLLRRDIDAAVGAAEDALRFSGGRGLAFHASAASVLLGASLVEQDRVGDGLARISSGIADTNATGAGIFQCGFHALLAAAHVRAGDPSAGLAALAHAAALMRQSGERWQAAELHRVEAGLVLAAGGPRDVAERSLVAALEIAREQQARSFELRAARDLARLWADQGHRQKARDLLAPIFVWFTEGLDTQDLVEARTLLDAL